MRDLYDEQHLYNDIARIADALDRIADALQPTQINTGTVHIEGDVDSGGAWSETITRTGGR
jgi:hypothetical protein